MDIIILLIIIGIAALGYAEIRSVYVQNKIHSRVLRLEKRFLQKELEKNDARSKEAADDDYLQKIVDFLNDNAH